jgi:hypothetical protein
VATKDTKIASETGYQQIDGWTGRMVNRVSRAGLRRWNASGLTAIFGSMAGSAGTSVIPHTIRGF